MKLVPIYPACLMREITRAIEKERLKTVMLLVLNALPDHVELSLGMTFAKNEICYHEFDEGAGLVTTKGNPIFLQISLPGETDYLLVTLIKSDVFNKIIFDLPDSEHKTLLQCLNLHPHYEKLAQLEAVELQKPLVALQPQKNMIPECEEYDLALVAHNAGVAYLQNHYHIESWEFLCDRMPQLKENGVSVLYLELPKTMLEPLFQHFNKTGDAQLLEEHINLFNTYIPQQNPYLLKLCIAAHKNNLTVLPIDSSSKLWIADNVTEAEMIASNSYRDGYMQQQLSTQQGKKFVVLLGIRHFNVARQLNLPAIGLQPSAETKKCLDPENPVEVLIESMHELEVFADFNIALPKPPVLQKAKSCCTPQLIRWGMFAAVGAMAATAAGYALQTLSP